ncbi:Chitinase 2 [Emydomyces testavorans]|uniref:Endochitinase 2 n=1 Tax=Emydomyces testavorans TaxID=2070801 RepID=A0AAF0DF68_9EURO|nr:Chitinase 2 [Emydomyces testavorans]
MGLSSILAVFIAVSCLSIQSLGLDPNSRSNLAVYWGQGSGQNRLSYFCQKTTLDIIIVGFINVFPDQGPGGWPGSNFGNQCAGTHYYTEDGTETKLLNNCRQIQEDLPKCKALGKTILLSLGGGAAQDFYEIKSGRSALDFADFLWGAFGPRTPEWTGPRPFGDTAVDGFDFDIEKGSSYGYSIMVNRLRQHFGQDPLKKYYISAAPQCIMPDAYLGDAISKSAFDFIFVQFYNNIPCSAKQWVKNPNSVKYTVGDWAKYILQSGNPSAKLFIGLPADETAAAPGNYLTLPEARKIISTYVKQYPNTFGGVMLWEATQSEKNKIDGSPYADKIKAILLDSDPTPRSSTVTSMTTATSFTKSSSVSSTQISTSGSLTSGETASSTVSTRGSTQGSVSSTRFPSATDTKSTQSTLLPSSTGQTSLSMTVSTRSASTESISTKSASSQSSSSTGVASSAQHSSSHGGPSSATRKTSQPLTLSTSSASTGTISANPTTQTSSSTRSAPSDSSTIVTRIPSSPATVSRSSASSGMSGTGSASSSFVVTRQPSGSATATATGNSSTRDTSSEQPSSTQGPGSSSASTVLSSSQIPTSTSIATSSRTTIANPTTLAPPPSSTITTIITTSYVTICPTGFTTVTTTYTTTYCPQPPHAPIPGGPAPPPDGWTTIVTECPQCATTPTTVTLTVPTRSAFLPSPTETRPIVTVAPLPERPATDGSSSEAGDVVSATTAAPKTTLETSNTVGSNVSVRPTGGSSPPVYEGGAVGVRGLCVVEKVMMMVGIVGLGLILGV